MKQDAIQKNEPYSLDLNNRQVINTIKQTVAKGASDAQLAQFLEICKATGLNPFLREIWCIPKTNTIMAARDGYLRIANEHPQFDGMESYTVDDKEGKPLKGVCIVHRKDRSHPVKMEAKFSEYFKSNAPVWKQYPSMMIIKVAEVLALKRSFAINGVVTEEEIGTERPSPVATETPPSKNVSAPKPPDVVHDEKDLDASMERIDKDSFSRFEVENIKSTLRRTIQAIHVKTKKSTDQVFQEIAKSKKAKFAQIDKVTPEDPERVKKLAAFSITASLMLEGLKDA